MDYESALNETRTDGEQTETPADFRVSFESRAAADKEERLERAQKSAGKHLYFIQIAGGRKPVKIGRADRPLERLKTLQVASPYELKLRGTLDDFGHWEGEFHSFLSGDRMLGEWFRWSVPVEQTVKLALSGGDWQTHIAERVRTEEEWEWWEGSPLYAPARI